MTPRLALALFAFALCSYAPRAQAYCRTRTSDPESSSCPADCATEGVPLAWFTSRVTYALNSRGFAGLSQSDAHALIGASFGAWASVTCAGKPTGLHIVEQAETPLTLGEPEGNTPERNVNVISELTADEWRQEDGSPQAYAVTRVWFSVSSGEIVGADMLFNGALGPFGQCPDTGCPAGGRTADLRNVATHEAGHVLGLAHSDVRESTMYCGASAAEVDKRTLSDDDILGLCAAYPPGTVFPRDARVEANGGGSCALAGTPHASLALLACLLTWRRRRASPRHR